MDREGGSAQAPEGPSRESRASFVRTLSIWGGVVSGLGTFAGLLPALLPAGPAGRRSVGLLLVLIAAWFLASQFDIQRAPFGSGDALSEWTLDDWSRAVFALSVLLVAAVVLVHSWPLHPVYSVLAGVSGVAVWCGWLFIVQWYVRGALASRGRVAAIACIAAAALSLIAVAGAIEDLGTREPRRRTPAPPSTSPTPSTVPPTAPTPVVVEPDLSG